MKYQWLFASIAIGGGCNEVVSGTCHENPTGGAGGTGSIPIGAGVGASVTGDYAIDSPDEPMDAPNPPPGCAMWPGTAYINCRARGLDAAACSEVCMAAEAYCVGYAVHPYKSGLAPGRLVYCKNGWPSYTCTYEFDNGDSCVLSSTLPKWLCIYAGG